MTTRAAYSLSLVPSVFILPAGTARTFSSHKRFVIALVHACRVSSLSEATSAVMSSTETAPHLVISISRPGSEARLRSVFAHPWRMGAYVTGWGRDSKGSCSVQGGDGRDARCLS